MIDSNSINASPNKEEPSDFLSTIGLLMAMPLLTIGLFSQAYISLTLEWYFQALALFSFVLGLAGLMLAFSKVKKGIPYGSILICIASFLSILFSINTDVLKETPNTTMVVIGAIISAVFGTINYACYYWEPKSK